MEDLEIEPTPEFLKGFTQGYEFAEAHHKVAARLFQALKETHSEISTGFKAGVEQYEYEMKLDRYYQLAWLDRDTTGKDIRYDDPDKDKVHDKDDHEPEKS